MLNIDLCKEYYPIFIGKTPGLTKENKEMYLFLHNYKLDQVQKELPLLQQSNLDFVLSEARKLNIRYLVINRLEIWGTQNIKCDGWPAIWKLVRKLGIHGGCGNTDQAQTVDTIALFPKDAFNKRWDTFELTFEDGEEYQYNIIKNRM